MSFDGHCAKKYPCNHSGFRSCKQKMAVPFRVFVSVAGDGSICTVAKDNGARRRQCCKEHSKGSSQSQNFSFLLGERLRLTRVQSNGRGCGDFVGFPLVQLWPPVLLFAAFSASEEELVVTQDIFHKKLWQAGGKHADDSHF